MRSYLALLLTLAMGAGLSAQFPRVRYPLGNQHSNDKAMLGKALFFEEQLSATRTVACATCHGMRSGGSDHRSLSLESRHPGVDGQLGTRDDIRGSLGVISSNANGSYRSTPYFGIGRQVTARRAMSVVNAAIFPELFWDGRARSVFRDPVSGTVVLTENAALESQAVGPIVNDVEMAHFGERWSDVVARLQRSKPLALASNIPTALATWLGQDSYPALFRKAFGTTAITASRIAMAIATYERTLLSNQSPFDRRSLNRQQQRGQQLFNSRRTRCASCHSGPLQTDNRYHYTGVTPQSEDVGRMAVTRRNEDRGRQRTPQLRNVALRAPYFHNGSARTLSEVVDFYDRGGDFTARNKDRRIQRLRLNGQERADLVAFLEALTDPRVASASAPFDEPTLWSRSTRAPTLYGQATPGSGAIAPRMVAHSPADLGNPRLTLGVDRGHGGSPALLFLDAQAHRAGIPVLGVRVHLAVTPALVALPSRTLSGTGAGRGHASVALGIPSDPTLRGARFFTQWLIYDVGVRRFSASQAAELAIF